MSVIPLFSTSASLMQGGIFSVEKAGAAQKLGKTRGPISLCDLAKDNGLKQLHLIESNFVNFMVAYKNLKEANCNLAFGLKVIVCADIQDKSEASLKTESKVVLFMKNSAGYKPLIDIYTKAAQAGFYYVPRIDWKSLCEMWSDNLILSLPFYSSFIAKNTLTFSQIVPQMPVAPLVLREVDQQLPIDDLIDGALDRYLESHSCPQQKVKSVYYLKRDHAKRFMVWRCALDGKTFDKPNMDFMHSREFCYEAFKELK